jgi:hypothetical protein
VRLEDSGKVIGEGLCFFSIASCPCILWRPNRRRRLRGRFKFFCSFPHGVVGGGRGGKTV